MSAECYKHGCDLVYPADAEVMVGVCQVCERESEIKRLRSALHYIAGHDDDVCQDIGCVIAVAKQALAESMP